MSKMWKKETLLVLIASIGFSLLVHGNSGGHLQISQEKDIELDKQTSKVVNVGVVKTIKTQNNDIIDCVDACKQPAFQHPLLKNHMIKWRPKTLPKNLNIGASFERERPSFFNSNEISCPENTVPIRRPAHTFRRNTTRLYEFAYLDLIHYPDDMFYGASAYVNANNPHCEHFQSSGASIWIGSDLSDQKNFIKAGWMVNPEVYDDTKTRISAYWTGDGFHKTGCYDLMCPGFVQVNRNVTLGLALSDTTAPGDPYTFDLYINVFQDARTKDWWLIAGDDFNKVIMGYWPKELFPSLAGGGTVLHFGGSAMTHQGERFPPMGDGRIPDGYLFHSNYFKQINYVNKSNYLVPPRRLGAQVYTDNPSCYGLIYVEDEKTENGRILYMGGPGGQC